MKRMGQVRRILSILVCLSLFLSYVPVGLADEASPLPQTPAAYAASDYARYGSRMAVGEAHIAVIKANGTLLAGGDNTYGQCDVPAELSGAVVKAVAAGTYHTLALTEDGKAYQWGSSYVAGGQIAAVSIPAEVEAVQGNIKLIAAGASMSAVLTNANQLIVWGYNTNDLSVVPEGLGNVVALAINGFCVVTLNDEGDVKVWGNSNCSTVPDGLDGIVVAVATGQWHWLALKKDGTVSVTGSGSMISACGNIANESDVRAIAGGWQSAGAILADGSVKCWGRSPAGYNTDGLVQTAAGTNIRAFTCTVSGGLGSSPALCAMQEDGAIKILAPSAFTAAPITDQFNFLTVAGDNADLSGLAVAGYDLAPVFDAATLSYTVNVPNEVSSVDITATTADTAAAMKINGTAAASGSERTVDNLIAGDNQVAVEVTAADGATVQTYTITIARAESTNSMPQTPAAYAASDYAKYNDRMAAGKQHAAAVLQEGTVEVWGDNSSGQLEIIPQATGVKALAAGVNHTLALKGDGAVAAWGYNSSGQCNVPAELAGKTVKAVTANSNTSAALTEDNQIYVWGQYNGVLVRENDLVKIVMNGTYLLALVADGSVEAWKYSDLSSFEVPEGFSGDVVDIKAGSTQALALKKNGSVAGWNDSYLPTGLTGVRSIMAGRNFSAAIYQDGVVTTWGADNSGYGYLSVPSGLHPAVALTAGWYDMYALQSDGTVVSWGRNHYGQGDVPEDLNLYSEVSTNDRLVNLAVETLDGADLSAYPEFSCVQTAGVVEVASDIAQVRITAQAYSSAAVLTINGNAVDSGEIAEITLDAGDNPIEIVVTAASGSQRIFTLHVKRADAGDVLSPLPQTPEAYQESDYAAYSRRLGTDSESVLAVKDNGTVAAWGQNQNTNIPPDAVGIKAVAAGSRHSLALKDDGTVVAWGYNDCGQCNVPADLSDVVDICIVGSSSIVLQANGAIRAWGQNQWGECNIPETLSGVVDIQSGGGRYVLALKADGTVTAWGDNTFLQSDVPAGLDHVVAIAAGFYRSVALKDDGTIVIWGAEGTNHEIGNLNQHHIKGVTVGSDYIATLKTDGSVVAWDADMKPVLGIPVNQGKKTLAIGGYGQDHLVCLYEDGTVKVWAEDLKFGIADIPAGLNLFVDDTPYSGPSPDIPQTPVAYASSDYARAAAKICYMSTGLAVLNMDGTVKVYMTGSDYYNLAEVPEGLSGVKSIATSGYNVMALKEDGMVVAWGYNGDGQCDVPADLSNVTQLAISNKYASSCCLALKEDGTVTTWGGNQYGEGDVPSGLSNVTAIAAGGKYCLALKADGTVVAWGNNDYGQCDVPAGLDNVARIYASDFYDFCLALKNDGTLVAWGSNYDSSKQYYCGQCDVPAGLTGVVDFCVSGSTCIALKSNGTVVAWGNNYYASRSVPAGLHEVAAINFGAGGANAIKADGSVEVWGNLASFDDALLTGLSGVLTIAGDIVIFRDGSLQYFPDASYKDDVNTALAGLNVLSGHYFTVEKAELLNPAGQSVSSVAAQGGYRIKASVTNNNAAPTDGLTIIQVRGGSGASSSGGGLVLGCVGLSSEIPVTGSTVTSDFTMPAGISGTACVDVFVWDGWDTMVPRAEANQDLSFSVTE